jgi:catechol 2,3-dioxygenase-like lactoylglutathione lyase family enzyme
MAANSAGRRMADHQSASEVTIPSFTASYRPIIATRPRRFTMSVRLEHANLVVRDVDEAIRFIQTAFPTFLVRREGRSWTGARWVHVGTDDTYLALNEAQAKPAETWVPYSGKPGLNHLGYEVADVEALRTRLKDAGYRDSTVANQHPHRTRVYFNDAEGNDWEFVQYLSDDPAERNDYDLPDST